MGVTLPVTLPFVLTDGSSQSYGVTLPVTLPFVLGGGSAPDIPRNKRVKLPLTLPMTFNTFEIAKKQMVFPSKITTEFANEHHNLVFPVKETIADSQRIVFPVKEYALDFKGLIIEENVVAHMRKDIVILEDVRSRILFNVELLNRNTVKVSWYGEAVPSIEVLHKMEVDEEWTSVGTFQWAEATTTFNLDNNEHHVKLVGVNGTGESGICVIGEATYVQALPKVGVLINEKIYNVDIEYAQTYRLDILY